MPCQGDQKGDPKIIGLIYARTGGGSWSNLTILMVLPWLVWLRAILPMTSRCFFVHDMIWLKILVFLCCFWRHVRPISSGISLDETNSWWIYLPNDDDWWKAAEHEEELRLDWPLVKWKNTVPPNPEHVSHQIEIQKRQETRNSRPNRRCVEISTGLPFGRFPSSFRCHLTWLQTSQQKGPEESAYRCDVHLDAMGAVAVSWQFSKGRGIEEWSQSFEKMTFARNITKNQHLFAPNTTSKN